MNKEIILKNKIYASHVIFYPILIIVQLAIIGVVLLGMLKKFDIGLLGFLAAVLAFMGFGIYLAVWEFFGRTILEVSPDGIMVTYKNKLFSKPQFYPKNQIKEIDIIDLYETKFLFLTPTKNPFVSDHYAVELKIPYGKRIVDWITYEEAQKIIFDIEQVLKS